jgi:hypothetical protein
MKPGVLAKKPGIDNCPWNLKQPSFLIYITAEMANIGFIGRGIMGKPMAASLSKADKPCIYTLAEVRRRNC